MEWKPLSFKVPLPSAKMAAIEFQQMNRVFAAAQRVLEEAYTPDTGPDNRENHRLPSIEALRDLFAAFRVYSDVDVDPSHRRQAP